MVLSCQVKSLINIINTHMKDRIDTFLKNHNVAQKLEDKAKITEGLNKTFLEPVKFSKHRPQQAFAKRIVVVLSSEEFFDPVEFSKRLINKVPLGEYYSVMIKIRFHKSIPRNRVDGDGNDTYVNSIFKMAGTQFVYNPVIGDNHFTSWSDFSARVTRVLSEYQLSAYDISYIELSFISSSKVIHSKYRVDTSKRAELSKFLNINYNTKAVVPVSIDPNAFDNKVISTIENNKVIDIIFALNNEVFKWADIIKNSTPNSFLSNIDVGFNFYLTNLNGYYYIIGIKVVNPNRTLKVRLSIRGVVLEEIDDTVLPDNMVKRVINNKNTLYIKGDRVLKVEKNIPLKCIPSVVSNTNTIENPNIGVIDFETYEDSENIYRIYAGGFLTSLQKFPQKFYIDHNYDSSKVVTSLLDELLRPKYNKMTFYTHNLSGYDIVFILKVLTEHNESNEDKYIFSCKFRDQDILQINIAKYHGKIKHSIVIKDSYAIFNQSLSKLCADYDTTFVKSSFPHRFSIKSNLFYKGSMPNISYYDISETEYNKLKPENGIWCFRSETLKYLNYDLLSLYEVLTKANKEIFLRYNVDMIDVSTVSGLALKIFLTKYYDSKNKPIPSIKTMSMYNDIKQGYYGGMTEVYRPYGKNLYYYDVNSLYPFVALNSMPGLYCKKVSFNEPTDINKLFGFFYCSIDSTHVSNSYLGLLPLRHKGLIFPLGKWEGWYFSEELKFAISHGYKINVLNGYTFNKVEDVFKNYINDIFKEKVNAVSSTKKSIAKSLLNNLLGRFGISLSKYESKIVSGEDYALQASIREIKAYHKIDDDNYLINCSPLLSPKLISDMGWDISKVLEDNSDRESGLMSSTSVVISAAITSYARIFLNKVKIDILSAGGNLYYTDTDSVVTDIELPNNIVDSKELGKFKLEYKVKEGIFISGKTYCLVLEDGQLIKKGKGIKSDSLTYRDYLNLLNNDNVKANKTSSYKDYTKGSVKISTTQIILNSNAYVKREKILDNNMWADTKPLFINTLNRSLIIYEKPVLDLVIKNHLRLNLIDLSTKTNTYVTINTKNSNNYLNNLVIGNTYIILSLYILCTVLYYMSLIVNNDNSMDSDISSDSSDNIYATNTVIDEVEDSTLNSSLESIKVDISNNEVVDVYTSSSYDSTSFSKFEDSEISDTSEIKVSSEVESTEDETDVSTWFTGFVTKDKALSDAVKVEIPRLGIEDIEPSKEVKKDIELEPSKKVNKDILNNLENEVGIRYFLTEEILTKLNNNESFYTNSLIEHDSNANVQFISNNQVEVLVDMLDKVNTTTTELYKEIDTSDLSTSEGSINSETLKLIREGSYDLIRVISPTNIPENLPDELLKLDSPKEESSKDLELRELEKQALVAKAFKRPIVIVTKKVDGDDPIPALPGWAHLDYTHQDYNIKSKRLHNMNIADYTNSHVDSTVPNSTNTEWIETTDDLGLERLFNENYPNQTNNEIPKEYDNEFSDGYHLDKLFEDDKSLDNSEESKKYKGIYEENPGVKDHSFNSLLDLYDNDDDKDNK